MWKKFIFYIKSNKEKHALKSQSIEEIESSMIQQSNQSYSYIAFVNEAKA